MTCFGVNWNALHFAAAHDSIDAAALLIELKPEHTFLNVVRPGPRGAKFTIIIESQYTQTEI